MADSTNRVTQLETEEQPGQTRSTHPCLRRSPVFRQVSDSNELAVARPTQALSASELPLRLGND